MAFIFHFGAQVAFSAIACWQLTLKDESQDVFSDETTQNQWFQQWTFYLAAVYFIVSLGGDLPGGDSFEDSMFLRIRQFFFNSCLFPCAAVTLFGHFYGHPSFSVTSTVSPTSALQGLHFYRFYVLLASVVFESFLICSARHDTMAEISRVCKFGVLFISAFSFPFIYGNPKIVNVDFALEMAELMLKYVVVNLLGYILGSIFQGCICEAEPAPVAAPITVSVAPIVEPTRSTPPAATPEKVNTPAARLTTPSPVVVQEVQAKPVTAKKPPRTPAVKKPAVTTDDTATEEVNSRTPSDKKKPARKSRKVSEDDEIDTEEQDNAAILEQEQRPRELQSFGIPGLKSPLRGAPTTRLRSRTSILNTQ